MKLFLKKSIALAVVTLFSSNLYAGFWQFGWKEDGVNFETSIENTIASRTDTQNLLNNILLKGDFLLTDASATKSLCGTLYYAKKDDNGTRSDKKILEGTNVTLLDISFSSGYYTCMYENKNRGIKRVSSGFNLPHYKEELALYNHMGTPVDDRNKPKTNYDKRYDSFYFFEEVFKPDQLEYYRTIDKEKVASGGYNVFADAERRGLWNVNAENRFNNGGVTLSQFVMGLITFNSSIVKGVDSFGDIIIAEDIKEKMMVLDRKNSAGMVSAIADTTTNYYNAIKQWVLQNKDTDNRYKGLAENMEMFSYEQYFDKKVFGMYYTFMGIAWGNVFAYGAFLFLSIVLGYSASIILTKYGIHKLQSPSSGSEDEKPFDFPLKTRLVTIGATLALSFIHFPTGEGVEIVGKSGVAEKMNAQTSIAKSIISYMGNLGTVIADVSASNTVVVYMDYLLKATNTHSVASIDNIIKETQQEIFEQKLLSTFYINNCTLPYKNRLDKVGSFGSVGANEITNPEWNDINPEWKSSFQRTIFGAENREANTISLGLCKSTENKLIAMRELLSTYSRVADMAIEKLTLTTSKTKVNSIFNTDGTLNDLALFSQTQLSAISSLGWINIASVPLLHVYLSSIDVLEIGKERPTMGIGSSAQTRAITNQAMSSAESESDRSQLSKKMDETNFDAETSIKGAITSLMSYQVYFLLPAFNEVRQGIEKTLDGAVDVAMQVVGVGKFASLFKTLNKFGKKRDGNKSAYAVLLFVLSFFIAIYIYKLLLKAIFASLITLMVVVKITLYMLEVFKYFFVSPLIVAWQLTINGQTDRVNKFIVDGFVSLMVKPTLIVFSMMMFIIGYEIMNAIYALVFNLVFSAIQLADKFFPDTGGLTSMLIISNIKGFGEVMVQILGMLMAYKIIFDGDKMMLSKFGYKDDSDTGVGRELVDKSQALFGGRV